MAMVEQRPVVTGVRQQGFVEILDGVKAGDRVVADGLNKVQPGQPVRISPRPSMIPVNASATAGGAGAPPGAAGMRRGAPSTPPAGARPMGPRPAP